MISAQECMPVVLTQIPAFEERWKEYLSFWAGEESGLCNDIGEFGDYVIDQIRHEQEHLLPPIFDLVERLMAEGDDEVKTAVSTCLLDNLKTVSMSGAFSADKVIGLLGPQSRAHWDAG